VPNVDILILAIIRGASEILPIDAAAHTLLLSRLLCWPAQGNLINAAGDGGILVALLVYFWRDMLQMVRNTLRVMRGKSAPGAALIAHLLIGSLPAFAITFALRDILAVSIQDPVYVAVLLVAFAVVLYVADHAGLTVRRLDQMNVGQAAIVGLLQGLAVLPGVSRGGMVLTVMRILGYERADAARFMLLLSIPWMAASGLYRIYRGIAAHETIDPDRTLLMGCVTGVTAFIAIAFLMYWMRRGSVTLFALYRVALGAALIYALYALPMLKC
jgi:undecaprenyl-diphosphatase